jgi:galactose-1-phosphate uridylyltransferase
MKIIIESTDKNIIISSITGKDTRNKLSIIKYSHYKEWSDLESDLLNDLNSIIQLLGDKFNSKISTRQELDEGWKQIQEDNIKSLELLEKDEKNPMNFVYDKILKYIVGD